MSDTRPIAAISGANRGLGFETARQLGNLGFRVVLTSRDGIKGKAATDKLQSEGLDVLYHPLDVEREESRLRLFEYLEERLGRLDVLINNAGVMPEGSPDQPQHASVFDTDLDQLRQSMEINLYGPLRLCQQAVPIMRRNGYGRIVNVSSGLAQLSEMRGAFAAYRMSKVALNALTRIVAAEVRGDNILVNSVSPGWVRTRMGGTSAPRAPVEAVRGITWLATLDDDGPSGGFYQDRMAIPW
ncbi:SDR family oxidoreductase [Aquisalimonas lutea]|uniref:SDR family oxidoreductase n=1 Tax=Aquisalimonas lutea TaxID=1327750 RepID=UPI0025B52574|nr:SDR family oxidoreductase [Aquisalimonas lutea]MDN3518628.1 SDR family oxidoreductase [Aquisalimonas lutea]